MPLVDLFTALRWIVPLTAVLVIAHRYGLGYHLMKAAVTRNPELARSAVQAARIRRTWPKVAQHLKLVLVDKTQTAALSAAATAAGTVPAKARNVIPRIRVRPDRYGVVVQVKTITGVGLQEWQKVARHVSDEWRSTRVSVTQPRPGRLRVRAVRIDPLLTPTVYAPEPTTLAVPANLDTVVIGVDEYAEDVRLRLKEVAGIGIYGMPGSGKSSLVTGLITRLAPHPCVQFIGFDGKVDDPDQGDYADVADRFSLLVGDDVEEANRVLTRLADFRRQRAGSIRAILGCKDVWTCGFTVDWPLLVIIIDEAHTYFSQVKDGGDKDLRRRNALAAQNVQLVEDLVKKGRSVGLLTIITTQKGTGDAVPTSIRDVCAISLSFAARTIDAAIAALGEDIRNHPEGNPTALMGQEYVGVASMAIQGRPGFIRVRTPYIPDATSAAVARLHRDLVLSRGELPSPIPAPAIRP